MIDGPHIFGFSPVALCINLTSALASARLVSSVRASINAGTLSLVGLVLLSAIAPAFPIFQRLIQRKGRAQPGTLTPGTLHRGPCLHPELLQGVNEVAQSPVHT